MRKFEIRQPDHAIMADVQTKIDNLNKPKGSLGQLEDIAAKLCLIQQSLTPKLINPCHLLFGGDHGIEREGVSISPREVTWQQMINFANGGGGVNMFCRQHGFKLYLVDIGVDYDLSGCDGIINKKIANGTANFLYGPAMDKDQFDTAINIGASLVDECHNNGCNIISIGEMGIANTSPSSVWMSLFGQVPLKDCVGAGAGLNSQGIKHKYEILSEAIKNYKDNTTDEDDSTENIIRYFGGFEMVGTIGAMLRAAELRMIILIDGFIMTACALAVSKLYPEAQDYMIFGHVGDEGGHRRLLNLMEAKPILDLGLRLGEGTGAICAFPIIDSAVRMINEMNNFDNAHIIKYF